MGNRIRHRRIAEAALGAMLACAWPAAAQDATPEPSLTGIPDIDFSLEGKPAENPGTPTEGRSLRPAEPSEAPGRAGESSATATTVRPAQAPREAVPPDRPQTDRPEPSSVASAEPDRREVAVADEAPMPDRGTVQPFDVSTVTRAVGAGGSGIPAWPFGLALVVAVAWFVFRRRNRAYATGESPEPEQPAPPSLDLEAEMELSPEPASPPPAPTPPVAEPVATPPAPAPEAHPALRVRIPEPAPVQPPAPPAPPITLYDAFGRPIVAKPTAPKPAPSPPPKPRAKIVRYNAMGLPIRD